ncbi:MAG: hypothetical protein EBQ80_00300 [Proteobacteria bacterium]|nr:hypothetical protein [Pseudomonadota bacterium]
MQATKALFWITLATPLLLPCGLVACQAIPPLPHAAGQPKLAPPPLATGPWQASPRRCEVRATTRAMSITTNGKFNNNIIELRINFTSPIAQPPTMKLTRQALQLATSGSQQTYTVRLPANPAQAADLMDEDEQLDIRFQPTTQTAVWQQTLPTQGLMFALANLGPNCP